jgi:hypothetical protein
MWGIEKSVDGMNALWKKKSQIFVANSIHSAGSENSGGSKVPASDVHFTQNGY